MKSPTRYALIAAAALLATAGGVSAAEEKTPAKEDRKSMRVLSPRGPFSGPRDGERREKMEMETIAFLGVETSPISTTMAVQLGLPRGTGLAVNHIVPKSPVEGVLDEHDILLKLDDQILIETRQLSVLIRTRKEGDEVTLTYLRAGQRATAKVKLGKHDVPKMSGLFERNVPFAGFAAAAPFEYSTRFEGEDRAEVDRVLSLIKRAHGGEPVRIQVDSQRGPGFRAMALHTGDSTMVFSDDEGTLELSARNGVKSLVAKNAQGDQLFSGPVNTPEERQAMPEAVRTRLEKLEGMHDITFRTDGDFRGAQMKVLHPRGIAFPLNEISPRQRASVFY